jgi:hypothetical protein
MASRPRPPGSRTGLFLMVVTLVAGACGVNGPAPSSDPASPTAAISPTVSASAAPAQVPTASARPPAQPSTPVDVAKAFRTKMAATQAFDATIDGMVTVGDTSLPAKGTLQVSGSDSHQVITIATGKPQTTETVTIEGTTYTRRGDVWFGAPATSSTMLADAFDRALAGLTDLGSVSIAGRELHRLVPPPGTTIPMTSFGTSPSPAGGTMTVEFYAEEDGTPAVIAIDATWTQKAGKVDQKASMHLDFRLGDGAKSVTIVRPSPIWVTGHSKRLTYTLSYPSEWDVELARKGSDPDFYYGLDGQGFAVTRTKRCACTLNAMTTELIRYQRQHVKGFKVVHNATTRIAGLRARVFESRGTYPGGRAWDLTYVVVRGKYVYVLDYSSEHPLTKVDRETAPQLVGSVAFR